MKSHSETIRAARGLLATWLWLIALTAGSFWIADVGGAPGTGMAAWVIGIGTLKAHFVAGVFMELLHAPRVWLVVMSGFLIAQGALLVALLS